MRTRDSLADEHPPAAAVAHKTILLAEDDAVLYEALSELFALEGYVVVGAQTLADANSSLERQLDGAVVDWRLGSDVSEPVVRELAARGVATVLLSAHPEARAVADAYGIPCVHKPFNVDQLIGIVSGALSRTTLRRLARSRG